MKRFFLVAAAAALFTASSASVSSADNTAVSVLNAETTSQAATEVVVESAPVTQTRRVYRRRPTNVFQNLMELERRKNAWLRRTFLGR